MTTILARPTNEEMGEALRLLLTHGEETPDGVLMSATGLAYVIAHARSNPAR